MTFRLYTFGGVRLEADEIVVRGPPAQRRRLALLALLAASDRRKLSREKAFGYLWPEHSTSRARHLLSESLYVLRRLMGEDVIVNAQDDLVLNPDVLWSDVVAFQDGTANGSGEDVAQLYRGPFLDGFHLKNAAEFTRWAETHRDRFSRQFARALESLAEMAAADGDALAATEWWRHLTVHDPYSSRVAVRYIDALVALGERGRAIEFAATHAARLRADLGVEPDPEFQATLSRLQQPASEPSAAGSGRVMVSDGVDQAVVSESPVTSSRPVAPTPPVEREGLGASRSPPARRTAMAQEVSGAQRSGAASPAGGRASVWPPASGRTIAAVAGLAVVMAAVLFARRSGGAASYPALGTVRAMTFEPGLEIEPNLSPDGRFVAYAGGTPSRIYLRQEGSRPVLLVTPDSGPAQHRPRWSPDGARIAFDADHRIFEIPALGGVPRQVVADGWSPAWAPDGRRIAYALGDTIFVTDLNGGKPEPLTVVIQPAELAWSPDGHWIALTSGNDSWDGFVHIGNLAQSRIILVGVDDGRLVEVTDRGAMNVAPTWAPNSRQLFFISNREGARDIYAVSLGSDGRPIGDPARLSVGIDAHSMALASTGDRLVYAAYHGGVNIWSVRIPSGAPVGIDSAVALTVGNQTIESISVSPDRRWVYFTSDRAGNSDIWRLPLAGGEPVQVTSDRADEFAPEVSPDGEWLAYYSLRGGTRDLWLRPTGPGKPVRLTDAPEEEHDPQWSPDGTTLCYSHNTGAGGSVEVLQRRGSTWSQPIIPPDAEGVPNRLLGCAGWLPDGRHMVVQDPGHTMIALMPVGGGALRTIYTADLREGRPLPLWVRVEPHTGTIYFRDWLSIWALEPGHAAPREIVHLDDPSRRSTRIEMDVDGEHVFFSLGDPQSDLFVAELSRSGTDPD